MVTKSCKKIAKKDSRLTKKIKAIKIESAIYILQMPKIKKSHSNLNKVAKYNDVTFLHQKRGRKMSNCFRTYPGHCQFLWTIHRLNSEDR